jgi:integrase
MHPRPCHCAPFSHGTVWGRKRPPLLSQATHRRSTVEPPSRGFNHEEQTPQGPLEQGQAGRAKGATQAQGALGHKGKVQLSGHTRNLALFNLAIDSKLRGCDLVCLRIRDVSQGASISTRAIVLQRKTHRPVQFEISEQTRTALLSWIHSTRLGLADFLFPGGRGPDTHLSTRQYARIVDAWVASIGLDPHAYGTHSMRRTKAALIYRQTKNLRAVQLLLGHTKLESTVRYLGIEVEDALELAEQTEA